MRAIGTHGDGGAEEPASVYPPREDTHLLEQFAHVPRGMTALEVGVGSGPVALTAARSGGRVVGTDLNPHALRFVRAAARAEGLSIDLVRTDLARGLGRFERVLANPPYLPTRVAEKDPDRWHNLALDGGPDGCRVTARLVEDLADHLTPRGEAYIVVSTVQDGRALSAVRAGWEGRGGNVEVAGTHVLEGERLDVWRLTGPGR